jgi:hypothetical protein
MTLKASSATAAENLVRMTDPSPKLVEEARKNRELPSICAVHDIAVRQRRVSTKILAGLLADAKAAENVAQQLIAGDVADHFSQLFLRIPQINCGKFALFRFQMR